MYLKCLCSSLRAAVVANLRRDWGGFGHPGHPWLRPRIIIIDGQTNAWPLSVFYSITGFRRLLLVVDSCRF